jgi:hypothetical protein
MWVFTFDEETVSEAANAALSIPILAVSVTLSPNSFTLSGRAKTIRGC